MPTTTDEATEVRTVQHPEVAVAVTPDDRSSSIVLSTRELEVYYGPFRAVRGVNLDIRQNEITAFIGP